MYPNPEVTDLDPDRTTFDLKKEIPMNASGEDHNGEKLRALLLNCSYTLMGEKEESDLQRIFQLRVQIQANKRPERKRLSCSSTRVLDPSRASLKLERYRTVNSHHILWTSFTPSYGSAADIFGKCIGEIVISLTCLFLQINHCR